MYLLLIIGTLFLVNPVFNVIDFVPDCIGWALIACGLSRIAYLREDAVKIKRRAWILCLITAAKILPMVWSLAGDMKYPLAAEPTMILTYAVCFGAAEFVLALMVFFPMLDTFAYCGLRYRSTAPFNEPKPKKNGKMPKEGKGLHSLKTIIFLFFLQRSAGSIIPELVYLRSTEYLSDVTYGVVIDIRDYRPYLIYLCAFVTFIFAIVFLIKMQKYLIRLSKDTPFNDGMRAEEAERVHELSCAHTVNRFRVSFALLFLGSVFFCYLSFEKINILPDAVGVLLMLTAFILLKKYSSVPSSFFAVGGISLLVTGVYAVIRAIYSLPGGETWSYRFSDFLSGNVELTAEKEELLSQQWTLFGYSLPETVILAVFFFLVLRALSALNDLTLSDGVTLFDSMTFSMAQKEKEAYKKRPRICFALFLLTVLMEPVCSLPIFAFLITPVFLLRCVFGVVFLYVFDGYLFSLLRMITTHYTYN